MQPYRQVPRPAPHGARAGCRGAGDRSLRAAPDGRGGTRAASRRRSGARPELLPVRHDGRAARLPALSARPHAQEPDARAGRALRARRRRQARQPGHLLRAQWRLRLGGAEAPARGRRAGRDRRRGGPRRRSPRWHRALHGGPASRPGAGRPRGHRQRAALCRAAGARDAPRRRRAAVGARPQRDRALRRELAWPAHRRRAAGEGPCALLAGAAVGGNQPRHRRRDRSRSLTGRARWSSFIMAGA